MMPSRPANASFRAAVSNSGATATCQRSGAHRAARTPYLPGAAAPAAQAYDGQQHDYRWTSDSLLAAHHVTMQPYGAAANCSSGEAADQHGTSSNNKFRPETGHQCWQARQPAGDRGTLGRSASESRSQLLTAQIRCTGDVTDLLHLLHHRHGELDGIHVSAAIKHACRHLSLQLQAPDAFCCPQRQEVQQESELLWLRQLRSLLPSRHQQKLGSPPQQAEHREASHQQQHSCDTAQHYCDNHATPHEQQQRQQLVQQQHSIQSIARQQLEAHNTVRQQFQEAGAASIQQQNSSCATPKAAASDSWILLLYLLQLVQQHASSMGSQQLCTCLNGLTNVLLRHTELPLLALRQYVTPLQQLLQTSQQQLHAFEPKALALVLHSAAAIARSPYGRGLSNRFMKKWYYYSKVRMGDFSPLDISMSAWALGRLQLYPPSQWMAEFWTRSRVAVPSMGAQELVMMLVGVAYVEPVPRLSTTAAAARQGWLTVVAEHLQHHLQYMTAKQLSAVMLAVARLRYHPSRAWQQAYQQVWDKQQSQFTAAGHAVVLWGVGCMPQNTGQQEFRVTWAKKVQQALQAAVLKPASAVAAVALIKLRQAAQQREQQQRGQQQEVMQPGPVTQQEPQQQQPAEGVSFALQQPGAEGQAAPLPSERSILPQSPLVQVQPEQPQLLASASLLHPTDCAMAIAALARLGPAAVESEFGYFWLRQSRSQLGNMNSQELAVCLQSLGWLRLPPSEDWLQQAMACCAQQAACMSHQQLAMVLWGCARLKYLPNLLVMAELLMSAAEQLPAFSSHSLSLLVWSLGILRLKPNKEWMQLMLKQAQRRFRCFDSQDFYCLLSGLYRLKYKPGEYWLDLYAKALATKVHVLTPSNHHMIASLLTAMGYRCEGRPYAWIMDEAAAAALCDWACSNVQEQVSQSRDIS